MAVGGVINTGTHPKALWPGVKAWWGRTYAEHAEEWPMLFELDTSHQNYEEDVQITGYGLAPIKSEGSGTIYTSELQGFISRYVHLTYSLGYIVTKEELEDDLYESVSKRRAASLAFSFRQTKENVGANIYNRAFTAGFNGGDGVSLLNVAHPNTSGGTFSNVLAVGADLSEASLEDLIIQIMGATDDVGNLINIMPQRLIVPRQEWFNANRIMKSVFQSGTANNDINVIKATGAIPGGICVNHYLTSPHAWFIRTNAPNGLKMYQRVAISFEQDNDFDTDNAKAKSRERYSFFWTDPRGLFGSNGP
jgi:hypothetical protein